MSTSAISGLNTFLSRIGRRKILVVEAEPEWRLLIRKCYQLWGTYQLEPTAERRSRLNSHLSSMGSSKSRKVRSVRDEVWALLEPKVLA